MLIAGHEKHIIHLYVEPAELRQIADKMEQFAKTMQIGDDTTVAELVSDDEKYNIHVRVSQG